MLIQINTDRNIEFNSALGEQAEAAVRRALEHFTERITRVEVHLSDENSGEKVGTDAMRCVLEARLAGRPPVAVSDQAATVELAIEGAAEKMKHALSRALGRLDDRS